MANGKEGPLSTVLCSFTLVLICILAFTIRLFSVIKYESVIHEFDPYFNYRITKFLTKNGFYEFWNWFDDRTWYPLGRVIGGTVYPGLTLTAGSMYWFFQSINIPLSVETICVFTAPIFSANCAWATFLLTKEVRGNGAGLLAAAFISIVPSYISRSVAGSYDNEAVAIFALVLTFYFYIKTLNTGSLFYATLNSLSYFYMVMSWGGYTFIINLIPIHVLMCIFIGRFSSRLYIAFSPLIVLGTLLAALIPVVGFNAVMTSEHFGGFLVFIILHVAALISFLRKILPQKIFNVAQTLVITLGIILFLSLGTILIALILASPTLGWSGRSLSLLDPTYASKFIPIIASVSEHQPPRWPSYFMDLQILTFLAPAGIITCFLPLTDASSFVALYIVTSVYFSGVMVRLMLVLAPVACIFFTHVRLMLVLAPAACILSGISLSHSFAIFTKSIKYFAKFKKQSSSSSLSSIKDDGKAEENDDETEKRKKSEIEVEKEKSKEKLSRRRNNPKKEEKMEKKVPSLKQNKENEKKSFLLTPQPAFFSIFLLILLTTFYVIHCVWAAAEAYSAPSIVLVSKSENGMHVFDDFREAYSWMSHNTHVDDKVASWWDYGYQTTAMANRTVIVDNNTWNNTHIATVGTAMSSNETHGWKIFKSLDVKYVFVIFGGLVGYSGDDINKFLWMVRIGGGVFPYIKEADYLRDGNYRIDNQATPTMLNCLMYKLSYYRFVETTPDGSAYDRVRRTEIGKKYFKLTHFEEVFTSSHWMVRVYRLKEPRNRARGLRRKAKNVKGRSRN